MSEKFSPDIANIIMHLLGALHENDEQATDKILALLKEKGYLDKEEDAPTSIADEKWYCKWSGTREYALIHTESKHGARIEVACGISEERYATAIAALPELVKAAVQIERKLDILDCYSSTKYDFRVELSRKDVKELNSRLKRLKEALEKAGEKV